MTSILSAIESIWQKDEAFVLNTIIKIKSGAAVAITDLHLCLTWVAAHAAEITSDVQAVLGIVQQVQAAGIKLPPQTQVAIDAANTAMNAINAYAAAANSGQNTVTSLLAGYTAAKEASAAHSAVAIAVANAPVQTTAQSQSNITAGAVVNQSNS